MTKYFITLFFALGFLNLSAQHANDTLNIPKAIDMLNIKESTDALNIQKSTDTICVQDLIKEGVEQHDARDYKQAIKTYNEALKIDPNSMFATYELALSYLALRDYKNASKYSTKVIDSHEEKLLIGAYGVKSESLAETGKVDEAIALLESAIKELGNNYYLHFNLALNYFNKGNLDKTIKHVDNALNLDKTQSGAYLLSAYALNDKKVWVQSILSFQMFLLMEPNSHRSNNAFEEMLQVMQVKETTEKPIERSFIQKQLERHTNKNDSVISRKNTPPLNIFQGVNREIVYNAIESTIDSLKTTMNNDSIEIDTTNTILYNSFKEVTRTVFTTLSEENDGTKKGFIWSFHVPIITKILGSPYFDTYCRYISVGYFPESMEWWENNQDTAAKFVRWWEKGDEDE